MTVDLFKDLLAINSEHDVYHFERQAIISDTAEFRLLEKTKHNKYINEEVGLLMILGCYRSVGTEHPYNYFKVECECGVIKMVRASSVLTGKQNSCGCRQGNRKK